MSEQELRDWVTDASLIHGKRAIDVVPADVFLAVVERMQRAEQERDLRRLESLIQEHGATTVREALRR